MILAVGDSTPILNNPEGVPEGEIDGLGKTGIDLYTSADCGRSWKSVDTVVTGGKAIPYDRNSPIQEPESGLSDDGDLVRYFVDERIGSDSDHNRLVVYKVSGNGDQSRGGKQSVAAIPDEMTRPGMPTVTLLPNSMYAVSYKVVGSDYSYNEAHVKASLSGREWDDPTDVGTLISTADGRRSINDPYVTWARAGSKDETILVSGKQLVGGNRGLAGGNNEVVLANPNLDRSGDQEVANAPLSFKTEDDLDGRALVGQTTPLLPSRHGGELL